MLPVELARTFRRSAIAVRDVLRDRFSEMRNPAHAEANLLVMRYLNSNIEAYTQMLEFLDDYTGPAFRPSVEKLRLAFAVVPVNLHVQAFRAGADADATRLFVTCGVATATPLRYTHGGLSRQREALAAALEPLAQDHTTDTRFYARRRTLEAASAQIEALSKRVNTQWRLGAVGTVDALGLQLFSEMKQLYEQLCDLIDSFANIANLVDALLPNGAAQLAKPLVVEALSSQRDSVEAAIIR